MDVFRDRKFMLLLYPDCENHMIALETIKRSYDYALALHDKDIDKDGNTKKSHYHVVITVGSNAKWNTALAKELDIEMNYIQQVRGLDRALEYLIHYNDIEKYQYSIDEVQGNLKKRLLASINSGDKTEGEKITELIDIIDNTDDRITYSWFSRLCAIQGYYDVYRRSAILFTKMIDEHNRTCDYKRIKKSTMGFKNIEDTYETCPFESEDNNEV